MCAERASAPSFGHSDADKCCTRIPNTFLSLAAAAIARANVNAATAATARSCCTVPHVVGPLRERDERERGSSEYLWLVIHAFSLSPQKQKTLAVPSVCRQRNSYKRFLTIINNWVINNQFERVI